MEIRALNNWNKEYQLILDKIKRIADLPDDTQVQKKKFTLLNELLLKLCTSKNLKGNFKNLTSLILLFLNMYRKNYPIDIFSEDTKQSKLITQNRQLIKEILRQELKNGIIL